MTIRYHNSVTSHPSSLSGVAETAAAAADEVKTEIKTTTTTANKT
jgi:hypothetical protein